MTPCIACSGTGIRSIGDKCRACRGLGIGGLIFISPSQVADYELCPRKWWYRSVAKIHVKPTVAAALGTAIHARLADWYTKGVVPAAPPEPSPAYDLALDALPFLPPINERRSTLLIEQDLFLPMGQWVYHGIGDLVDIDVRRVHDYKSSKNPRRYGLKTEELPFNHAANVYGLATMQRFDWPDISLQWTYVPTAGKGKPYPVNGTLTREQAIERVAVKNGTCADILRDRLVTDPEQITPMGKGCGAFGGCPFVDRCSFARANPLAALINEGQRQLAEDSARNPTQLLNALGATYHSQSQPINQTQFTAHPVHQTEDTTMTTAIDPNLLARINAAVQGNAAQQAMPSAPPPQAAPVSVPVPAAPVAVAPPGESIQDVIARLQREAAGQAQPAAAPPPQQMPLPAPAAPVYVAPPAAPAPGTVTHLGLPQAPAIPQVAAVVAVPVAQAAPVKANGGTYTLYVNCFPLGDQAGQDFALADRIVQAAGSAAALANNVSHYREIDYGRYQSALSFQLDLILKNWTQDIVVFDAAECRDAMSVLRANAKRIIQGV